MSQNNKRKILWLTWEKQIRNRSMSKELEVPLFEILSDRNRYVRYLSCIKKTFAVLWREKPKVLICQNPSIILTLFLLGLKFFIRFRVVIDAHYGGIESWNESKTFQQILNFCNHIADLVIVTNESHASRVRSLGGKAFVCPDPLPNLAEYRHHASVVPRKVYFISSFEIDEPVYEVFRAAEILGPDGFHFYVTGRYQKRKIVPENFPYITFLGFVPEVDFYKHLFSSEIVVDLTEWDNCLVCGAYEALEANKPLVLSRKKALEEYFTGGTIFTENRAMEIAAAIRLAYTEKLKLIASSQQWVSRERNNMKARMVDLKSILERI